MSDTAFDNRPLATKAYHRLLEEIVRGARPAGTRISEESIAQELQISRTPAREALLRLSADGLVEREPRKGCRIAELDRDALRDRFQCRAMLEVLALESGFASISKEALLTLESTFLAGPDADGSLQADERLHELILEACPNRSLVEIIRKLQQQCHAFRLFRAVSRPAAQLTGERLAIVQAILKGEQAQAAAYLSSHILGGIAEAVELGH